MELEKIAKQLDALLAEFRDFEEYKAGICSEDIKTYAGLVLARCEVERLIQEKERKTRDT